LLATISVHPNFTTKAPTEDRLHAADAALRLLRDINSIVGPLNADFLSAFAFPAQGGGGRKRKRGSDDSEGLRNVETTLANSGALWTRAEDFWQVVGWTFNCSIRHKKRWERWRQWLELMLQVMEDEWDAKMDTCFGVVEDDGEHDESMVSDCLVVQYLIPLQGRQGRRRMMRAILADGGTKASNEFGEIFKDETKERKKQDEGVAQARKRMNLEEGEYGDFAVVDEDEILEEYDSSTIKTRHKGSAANNQHLEGSDETGDDHDSVAMKDEGARDEILGGVHSVRLRLRLLALLLRVSCRVPDTFTNMEDLLDLYTETMRPLPLSSFSALIRGLTTSSKGETTPDLIATVPALLANNLLPLLGSTALRFSIWNISQSHLEQHFLPFAASANSAVDSAKVSILLEHLLLLMLDELDITPQLLSAVETGVNARNQKAIGDARKKNKGTTGEEAEAREVLSGSAERLLAIVGVFESSGPEPEPSSSLSELLSLSSDEDGDETLTDL